VINISLASIFFVFQRKTAKVFFLTKFKNLDGDDNSYLCAIAVDVETSGSETVPWLQLELRSLT
jgi:hypothetical protein